MLEIIINSALFSTIALVLIHFLWQGVAVAVILKSALIITPDQHSKLRYTYATVAMLANLILPIVTFAIIYQPELLTDTQQPSIFSSTLGLSLLANESSLNADILFILPYLTMVWLSIVLCLAGKLIIQMITVNQLPKKNSHPASAQLTKRFLELVAKLNMSMVPDLRISLAVDVPMAIGWLKPVVLVPVSMVTGLTPAQLDMLLLHELAHIKRYDYLVNLLQSFIEIVLFFHPAVFWVSKQMRIEREYCSDDIAVQHCGNALAYAHTLTDTASLCHKHRHHAIPAMAMAASGGDLKQRVLRLVNHHSCTSPLDKSKWLASVIIVISFLIISSKELAQLNYFDISNSSNNLAADIVSGQNQAISSLTKSKQEAVNSATTEQITTEINSAQQDTSFSSASTKIDAETNTVNSLLDDTLADKLTNNLANNNAPIILDQPAQIIDENKTNSSIKQNSHKELMTEPSIAAIKTPAAKLINQTKAINTTTGLAAKKIHLSAKNKPTKTITQAPEPIEIETVTRPTTHKTLANPYASQLESLTQPLTHQDAISLFDNKQAKSNNEIVNQHAELTENKSFKEAIIINTVDPKYPTWAQRKKLELDLRVNFSINKDGKVKNIQIEEKNKSTYFRSAIIKAMEQWQFIPAEENGKPVESTMSKIFSFNLMNESE